MMGCPSSCDTSYDPTVTNNNASTDYTVYYVEFDENEALPEPDPWPFPLPEVMDIRGGTKPLEAKATARLDCAQRKALRCNRKGIGLRIRAAQ
jgi:hypothetical protein